MQIVGIIAPIFIIIGLGYLFRRLSLVQNQAIHILNSFVYYVSLPAIILISFWRIDWYDGEILKILGFNIFALFVFSIIILAIGEMFRLSRISKATLFIGALVGNVVYMGFPIGESAFGLDNFKTFLAAATPNITIGLVAAILVIEYLVVKSKNLKAYFVDFGKNPLILSLAAGVVLSLLKISADSIGIIYKPMQMLAATASPVALFALGAFFHKNFVYKHLDLTVLSSVLKLAIFPLLVFILAKLLNIQETGLNASVLAAAMPTAVTAFVVAEKYKMNVAAVANAIIISTIFSVATIFFVLFVI